MAYAAVTSLMHTISRCSKSHDYIRIVGDSSRQIIKLLQEEGRSLLNVLVGLDNNTRRFSSKRLNALDAQITEAVFKLEDVLESHLLDEFVKQTDGQWLIFCYLDIEELKQDIDSLIQTVNKLKAEYIYELSSSSSNNNNNNLPIYEEEEEEEEEENEEEVIVKSHESRMFGLSDEIIMEIKYRMSISSDIFYPVLLWGMAGIGKTAIAKKIFQDPWVSNRYRSCAFVTVGPEYQLEDVYLNILKQVDPNSIDDDEEMIMLLEGDDEEEKLSGLKRRLNEFLKDRKYLIVLDDVWDKRMLEHLFKPDRKYDYQGEYDDDDPEYLNKMVGSAIVLTSRLKSVAKGMECWTIPFPDEKDSWDLLRANVFGEEEASCPSELKKAGKKIAENCEGLPLTIITVANILSKQEMTLEHWNKVAATKQHSVYVEAYAKMHKVLLPSYYCLPQYLRPSFLYMGVFPQNYEISCTKLHMLWTAEGLIELNKLKYFVYRRHLKKLHKNSVIIVHSIGTNDTHKTVGLHSSFWYLCKKEAGKSKFFHSFTTLDDCLPQGIEAQRRLCIYNPILFPIKDAFDKMASVTTARSLLCTGVYHQYPVPVCFGLRLLRVLDALTIHFYEFPLEVLKLIHLTYVALTCDRDLPTSISKLWSLVYLIVDRRLSIKSSVGALSYLPVEIWDMKNLEHLQVMGSDIPDPPERSLTALFKLSKLLDVSPHSCTQRILENMPKLTKLGMRIELSPDDAIDQPLGCFNHISSLYKLSSFKCVIVNPRIMSEFVAPPPIPLPVFPQCLVKLTLSGLGYPWEEMSKISSLPNLTVLKLLSYAFHGPKWDVQDKEFPSLEVLVIEETDLVQWTFKDDYYIRYLRLLSIKHCYDLKEMSMDLSRCLKKIEVVDCNPLVLSSANKLKEDWDRKYSSEYDTDELDLSVHSSWDDQIN